MALDEWLLATAPGRSPVLRLYGWRSPTVSLGRHEPWKEVVDLAKLEAAGAALVRRPTGGRAVLHHEEMTYSVTADLDDAGPWREGLNVTLARISGALTRGLKALGVSAEFAPTGRVPQKAPGHRLCFESTTRFELSAEGMKAVGSAQYRTEKGFLQHGSIPMRPTLKELWSLGPGKAPSPRDPGLPESLRRCSQVPPADMARALAGGFEEEFGMSGHWVGPRFVDQAVVDNLAKSKYASAAWTFRR